MTDTGQPPPSLSSIFTSASLLPSSPLSSSPSLSSSSPSLSSSPQRPSSPSSKRASGERKRERVIMEEEAEVESLHLEFSVSDNGVGISAPDQAKLFNNFTQIDVTRKWAGTGLGLAICKQLVEAMGGEIFVKSIVGKGSTFFFRIPVALPSPPSTPSLSSSPFLLPSTSSSSSPFLPPSPTLFSTSSSASPSVAFLPPSLPRNPSVMRQSLDSPVSPKIVPYDFSDESVLVVEDNVANQKVMRHMLEKMRCKVTIANNGLQAIQLTAENKYSIIFMDQYMPECDGFTAGKQIKSDCEKRGVDPPKLIGFTGTFETRLSGVMEAVLVKPVRFDTLAELLSKYCRNKFSLS